MVDWSQMLFFSQSKLQLTLLIANPLFDSLYQSGDMLFIRLLLEKLVIVEMWLLNEHLLNN